MRVCLGYCASRVKGDCKLLKRVCLPALIKRRNLREELMRENLVPVQETTLSTITWRGKGSPTLYLGALSTLGKGKTDEPHKEEARARVDLNILVQWILYK